MPAYIWKNQKIESSEKHEKFKFKSKKHNPACLPNVLQIVIPHKLFPVETIERIHKQNNVTVRGCWGNSKKWPAQCCYEGRHTRDGETRTTGGAWGGGGLQALPEIMGRLI